MIDRSVNILSKHDTRFAINSLTLAFVNDPAIRWVWPDPGKYLLNFPSFIKAFGDRAVECKSAHYIGAYVGAAFWLPPSVSPNYESVGRLLQLTGSTESQLDNNEVFKQVSKHRPNEPFWYLSILGIDPIFHGTGLGSRLMNFATKQFDINNTLAYLESSNSQNIVFYEKHGFNLLGKVQVNKFPPIFPMIRLPMIGSLVD